MIGNYRTLTQTITERLNPEGYFDFEKSLREDLSSISYSDVLQFIRVAMKGVSPDYTQRSKEAGSRVKDHLRKSLESVKYEYQGSVMTNTHIQGYSDIDLLVISGKFYFYNFNEVNQYINELDYRNRLNESSVQKLINERNAASYQGNSLDDLKELRLDCENILARIYTECDISKTKSIKIKNKDLHRDVDVVISNWYDDVRSIIYNKGENRGIQIYHKHENMQGTPDYPFITIKRINDRGDLTSGRLRRMIRFLKNIKHWSSLDIEISSFDINAICYDINPNSFVRASFAELVPVLYNQLYSLCTSREHLNNLVSVNDREYIFRDNPEKLENLKKLLQEVNQVYLDLKQVPLPL